MHSAMLRSASPVARPLSPILATIALQVALGIESLAAIDARAANLSFLQDSAMGEFNEEDIRLLTSAFNAVVADPKTPATHKWKNDASGNGGELRSLAAFLSPKGESCKRVRITNQAKKTSGKATYTVCKMPEGWQLVPSDYAPVPPQKKK